MKRIRSGALLLAAFMLLQAVLPATAAAPSEVQGQEAPAGKKEQETQITARVPSASPSYYLTLPGSVALGEMDATRDYTQDYRIGVHVEQPGNLKLKITSDREIIYRKSDDSSKQMTGYNSFGTQYFTGDGEAKGTLTVYKEDIARAPKGTYTGNLTFCTSFVTAAGEDTGDTGQDKTDTSGTVTDDKKKDDGSVSEKTVTAHVLMEQNGQIKPSREESMCWPFFHEKAELKLRDDGQVEVTLYLIDPIPGSTFTQYGTPLEHIYATGGTADITVENFGATPGNPSSKVTLAPGDDSYGTEVAVDSGNKVVKTFVKDKSGGIFVPEDGTYDSSPIRFTVPLTAVKNSAKGTILLTAYVKPMTVWKQFFLVLDDVDNFGDETTPDTYGYQVEKSELQTAGVSGLKEYVAQEQKGNYTLYIRNADSQREQAGISQIASLIAAGQASGIASYYDISMECRKGTENWAITDTGSYVLEIRLPLDASKGKNLVVYRSHDGKASLMQPLAARKTTAYMDNTYYADLTDGYLYIYTSKFSVYGVYQSARADQNENGGDNNNNGGTDSGGDSGTGSRKDGTYTAKVSVRKSTNINSASMCAPMFYERADLKVSGNNTKVTIYAIDPIPKYASEGTPLSNVKVTANGTVYSGSVNAGSKVSRYFAASEQFIPKAGNYYATPITFTIPTSAIEKSAEGKVKMSAYVNAVMKSTQDFYLVFSDWKSGETESSGEATEIDETSTTTDTPASTAGNTGISTAATSSGSIKDGEYLVPVTAIKEKTEEASMMADYMYPKATLKVDGNTTTLTVYIQHTVAGIEDGGPTWISYNGTKAEKVSNAMEASGVAYDSFTFTLNGEVPSPMLVSMYIHAMKIEVKARLVFDFAKKTETALEEETDEGITQSQVSDSDTGVADKAQNEASGIDAVSGYKLVTDAGWLGILILVITALIGGAVAVWRYKKRR